MTTQRSTALLERLGISLEHIAARRLRAYPEAEELEEAETGSDGRTHLLTPAAARAWRALQQAAERDGERIHIVSAFRSLSRQEEIVRRKRLAGLSIEEILKVCAPPGYSEHHTGRAVDLATPGAALLETDFEDTSAFRWLENNARHFGFHLSYPRNNGLGYEYEPWHWCFDAARNHAGPTPR